MENNHDQYDQLFTALAKAQSEFTIVGKNRDSHYGGFADLEELINATRPALTKNGLSVCRRIDIVDGKMIYISILGHSSGQSITSKMPINPEKPGMQGFGGCLTYLARYTYRELVCVAIADDIEDNDDGNATEPVKEPAKEPVPVKVTQKPKYEKITKDQEDQLQANLEGYPIIATDLLNAYEVKLLSDLPKVSFLKIVNRIQEKKLAGEL